jgi:hypothetical protein
MVPLHVAFYDFFLAFAEIDEPDTDTGYYPVTAGKLREVASDRSEWRWLLSGTALAVVGNASGIIFICRPLTVRMRR